MSIGFLVRFPKSTAVEAGAGGGTDDEVVSAAVVATATPSVDDGAEDVDDMMLKNRILGISIEQFHKYK